MRIKKSLRHQIDSVLRYALDNLPKGHPVWDSYTKQYVNEDVVGYAAFKDEARDVLAKIHGVEVVAAPYKAKTVDLGAFLANPDAYPEMGKREPLVLEEGGS